MATATAIPLAIDRCRDNVGDTERSEPESEEDWTTKSNSRVLEV